MDFAIGLTLYEKDGVEPLSKRIALKDGEPVSDGSVCWMAAGRASHVEISALSELVPLLTRLTSQQALSLGTIRHENRPADGELIRVVTKKRFEATQAEAHRSLKGPRITRTKEFVRYDDGKQALLLIDFDRKGMPDAIAARIEAAGGLWALTSDVLPALKGIATVTRASTSAGLIGPDDTCFHGSGGLHIYLPITDGSDSARTLKVLLDRLWLAGLGWHVVSKAGSLLVRSLVDASVGSPERLIFEGAPKLEDGLKQDEAARRPVHAPGDVLDTRAALPDLTAQEERELERLRTASRRVLKPEQERVITAIVEAEAEVIATQTRIPREAARVKARERVRLRLEKRMLPPQTILHFDHLGAVEVSAVLRDPETYINETLADPLEGVDYGRCKAMVMRAYDGRGLVIHSFAHGGGLYRLVYDEDAIEEAIDACEPKAVADRLAEMLVQAAYEPKSPAEDRLVARAAKRAKCGKNPIKQTIKAARDQAAKTAAEAARERGAADNDNERPIIRAPKDKAEIVATLTEIEGFLAASTHVEPPMRNSIGRLVRVREQDLPTSLHLLVSERERVANGGTNLAPPKQTVLAELDEYGVAGLVEDHVRLRYTDRWGNTYFARLQPHFCKALSSFKDSKLPVVWGAQTLPLGLPDRRLLVEPGLHRDLKLFLQIDPALVAAIPAPEACTLAAAQEAFRFLCDDVLGDVETTPEGKVILMALMMSVIERHLLDERPAFFVTGSQAGAGKTTACHIIAMATTGKHAAAAACSPVEEERRKALLAQALVNPPLILWDNISRGAQLSCPHIEKAITSPTIEDRLLGGNEIGVASAATIYVFTGNRIAPKGDLATRSLVVDLTSGRPDPANRDFRHEGIIAWVQENRLRILQALYTILLVERPVHVSEPATPTRFKTWWQLVGRPLEIVSGVTISALFDQTVEEDENTDEVRALFAAWLETFGGRAVKAAEVYAKLYDDIATRLDSMFEADPLTRLREAFFPATGGYPPNYAKLNTREVGKRLKSLGGYVTTIGEEVVVRFGVRHDAKHGNSYYVEILSDVGEADAAS